MTTESHTFEDTFLGTPTFLDFNKIYPYIQRNMMGALDFKEMLSRLELMALHDPSFNAVINKFNNKDTYFKSAWISQFKKATPDVDIILYSTEGIKLDTANKNISHYILADKWQGSINAKLNSGELNEAELTKILKDYEKIINSKKTGYWTPKGGKWSKKNADNVIKATSDAFNALGIDLSEDTIRKTISNKIAQDYFEQKNKDKLYTAYTEIFRDNLSTIVAYIQAQFKEKANALKILKQKRKDEEINETEYLEEKEKIESTVIEERSINRLNNIALQTNAFQYDLIESSYFDVKGNNDFGTVNPSFLSVFFDLIKALIIVS